MRSQSAILASVAFFLSMFTNYTAASEDYVLDWPASLPGWGYMEIDHEAFAHVVENPTDLEIASVFEKMPEVQILKRENPAGPNEPCTNPYDFHSNELVRGIYCLPDGMGQEMIEDEINEPYNAAEDAPGGASGLELTAASAPLEDCWDCVLKCIVILPFCYHNCPEC